jgi:hypothetical protein
MRTERRTPACPVPMRAQRREQGVDLRLVEDPGQRPLPSHQPDPLPLTQLLAAGRQPARHRVRRDITASQQLGEQFRHRRQSAGHRARRQSPASSTARTRRPSPPARCALMNASTSALETYAAGLPTNAKNTSRSNATASTVFGRQGVVLRAGVGLRRLRWFAVIPRPRV